MNLQNHMESGFKNLREIIKVSSKTKIWESFKHYFKQITTAANFVKTHKQTNGTFKWKSRVQRETYKVQEPEFSVLRKKKKNLRLLETGHYKRWFLRRLKESDFPILVIYTIQWQNPFCIASLIVFWWPNFYLFIYCFI